MSALVIETPPAIEPVSLELAKTHLRVTLDDEDNDELIALYIQAARENVEDFCGRSLIDKGYRQSLDAFPYFVDTMMSQLAYPPSYYALPRYSTTLWNYSQMMKLWRSPLRKITKIVYISSVTQAPASLYPKPFLWQASQDYFIGDQVQDANGNLQEVTAIAANQENEDGSATSGSAMPSWATVLNGTTADGPLTWTCVQIPAPAGDFLYDPDSEPPRIFPLAGQQWPPVLYVPNAVQIHFTAGYGAAADAVPALAKLSILHMIANWYENRESTSAASLKDIPNHLQDALWSIRVLDYAPTRG
ncbi:MAG TPA: head-tail connector protein [Candidatus Acidoferrales bacterium]|nr:head-tail connector protein [Candidatus Acidoferrales bacterium]